MQVDAPPSEGVSKDGLMSTFFSQFDFVLHHVKGRSNVVVDALSRPTVSGERSDERGVPTHHVPDISHLVHRCKNDCNLHFALSYTNMVYAAFLQ